MRPAPDAPATATQPCSALDCSTPPLTVVLWSDDVALATLLQEALAKPPEIAVCTNPANPQLLPPDHGPLATLHLLLTPDAASLRARLLAFGQPFTVLWGSQEDQLAAALTAIQFTRSNFARGADGADADDATPRWRWYCPHCSDAAGEAHALHAARGLRALLKSTAI